MELFVGPLPEKVDHFSLRHFFQDFYGKFSLQMLDTYNPDETLRFALVRFDSENLAYKAIRRLNGKKLEDQSICVRQFVQRSRRNERRDLNWRQRLWQALNRRNSDRRRSRKVMVRDLPGFRTYDSLASRQL
jgi:RNA recognition motif-containing protein